MYSVSVQTISRSDGRSATASAAYRLAEKVHDHRTGQTFDFRRKSGVEGKFHFAPPGAPAFTTAELWNRAEAAEKRKNSTVAREVLVALPHELHKFQRMELAQRIAARLVERYQVAGSAGLHEPDRRGDQRNFHGHFEITTRRMAQDGSLTEKTRELDNMLTTGKDEVQWIREMCQDEINAALERAGVDARVDCRSLADQRAAAIAVGNLALAEELDRAPTWHEGPSVTAIRRRGGDSWIAEENDEREAIAAQIKEARVELAAVEAEIVDLEEARAAKSTGNENWVDDLLTKYAAQRAEEAARAQELEAFINDERESKATILREIASRQAAEVAAMYDQAVAENHIRDQIANDKRKLESENKRAGDLRLIINAPEPEFVSIARSIRDQMELARVTAESWRKAHPWLSGLADKIGFKLQTDSAFEAAEAAYTNAPERSETRLWLDSLNESKRELKNAQTSIERLRSAIQQNESLIQRHEEPDLQTKPDKSSSSNNRAKDPSYVPIWKRNSIDPDELTPK